MVNWMQFGGAFCKIDAFPTDHMDFWISLCAVVTWLGVLPRAGSFTGARVDIMRRAL